MMDDELVIEEEDNGIFGTEEMKLNPEMFKDKLIEGFKKECPERILITFKSDDDIWDYIMQQGNWEPDKEVVQANNRSRSRGIMVVGSGGTGVSSLAKLLAESGMPGVQVIHAGDNLRDAIEATGEKIIMVDSFARLIPDLPTLPPRPMIEEYDGRPRNREERRRGRRL